MEFAAEAVAATVEFAAEAEAVAAAVAAVEDQCGQCFNVIKRSINNYIEKYSFMFIVMLLFCWWSFFVVVFFFFFFILPAR